MKKMFTRGSLAILSAAALTFGVSANAYAAESSFRTESNSISGIEDVAPFDTDGLFVQADSLAEAAELYQSYVSASPEDRAWIIIDVASDCELNLDGHVYLRTSGTDSNIGFKPKASCAQDKPWTSMNFENFLDYQILGPLWKEVKVQPGGNYNISKYEQTSITLNCVGAKKTTWAGWTNATMVRDGKTYFAATTTPDAPDLTCNV